MRKNRGRLLTGFERGFSLIELLVAALLSTIIVSVAGTMVYQLFVIPQESGDHLQAIIAVDTVGNWIIQDGQQAQAASVNISPVAVTGGVRKLRLFCDYGSETHIIDYVLLSGNSLRRDDYLNDSPTAITSVIGQNITVFEVTFDSGKYQATVGATVAGIINQSTQLRYIFKPRF